MIFKINAGQVANLGFPRGGANPKGRTPTYYVAKISQKKLHENEEIGPGREARVQNINM